MTRFDRLDALMSRSVDRLLTDEANVIWRPMQRGPGGNYTNATIVPDPTRPVTSLRGVVTWRNDSMPVEGGANSTGGGTVFSARLLIDFDEKQFEGGPKPVRFDRLEIPGEPNVGERLVEIARLGDDGGVRLLCWCNVVK